jgi:hypothetical protein
VYQDTTLHKITEFDTEYFSTFSQTYPQKFTPSPYLKASSKKIIIIIVVMSIIFYYTKLCLIARIRELFP